MSIDEYKLNECFFDEKTIDCILRCARLIPNMYEYIFNQREEYEIVGNHCDESKSYNMSVVTLTYILNNLERYADKHTIVNEAYLELTIVVLENNIWRLTKRFTSKSLVNRLRDIQQSNCVDSDIDLLIHDIKSVGLNG